MSWLVYTRYEILPWGGTSFLISCGDILNFNFIDEEGYEEYISEFLLESGLKTGKYVKGHLNVDKYRARDEALITQHE